jgi:hypothetical protein
MDGHAKAGRRLGLVTLTLASLAAPVLIEDAAAAKSHTHAVLANDCGVRGSRTVLGPDSHGRSTRHAVCRTDTPSHNRIPGNDAHRSGHTNSSYRLPDQE